jgi:enoyl-CoA hydratase
MTDAARTAYRTLRLDPEGPIAWLTLHRPDQLNALDGPMCDELQDYFGALVGRPRTRVVILRGAGRAFCAGFDLKAAQEVTAGPVRGMRAQRHVSEIIRRMRRCPQPIVACVHAPRGRRLRAGPRRGRAAGAPSARMNVAMALVGLTGCDIGSATSCPARWAPRWRPSSC